MVWPASVGTRFAGRLDPLHFVVRLLTQNQSKMLLTAHLLDRRSLAQPRAWFGCFSSFTRLVAHEFPGMRGHAECAAGRLRAGRRRSLRSPPQRRLMRSSLRSGCVWPPLAAAAASMPRQPPAPAPRPPAGCSRPPLRGGRGPAGGPVGPGRRADGGCAAKRLAGSAPLRGGLPATGNRRRGHSKG